MFTRCAMQPARLQRRLRPSASQSFCLLFLLLCWLPTPVQAAGGKSIFKLGPDVDHKPFEVMLMYFTVFAITIVYESLVHYVNNVVTSHSGKLIVHHIYSEVMILGGISALLTVFENLGGTALFEASLFHYVHFVIFVMALLFIGLVGSLFYFIEFSWKRWSRFEFKVVEIETDPSLELEAKTAFMQQYVKSVRGGQKMLACIIYFRQNLPPHIAGTSFSRYMQKMQRKLLLAFLDLEWTTWAALSFLCTVAAVVTHITLRISDNELATIGLWVLFVGFGPLLVLVVTYFKIRKEFQTFTNAVQEMRQLNRKHNKTSDQRRHFWWGSPHAMTFMMQVMLVYQVFYLANCTINFTYRLWQISLGMLFIIICFVPSLFVFFILIPLLMPLFTILASLGDFLDTDTLERIGHEDDVVGKYRRRALRDRTCVKKARYLQERDDNVLGIGVGDSSDEEHHDEHGDHHDHGHESKGVLSKLLSFLCGGGDHGHGHGHGHGGTETMLISDEGLIPMADPHGHGHGHGHGETQVPDVICEECDLSPAAVTCGTCGILCTNCSEDYHKLTRFKDHHVIKLKNSLFAPEKPLLTDNPIINKSRTAASLYKKTANVAELVEAARIQHENQGADRRHSEAIVHS